MDEKPSEIPAVSDLLRLLDIKGCIVTVNALDTQKDLANEIQDKALTLRRRARKLAGAGASRPRTG